MYQQQKVMLYCYRYHVKGENDLGALNLVQTVYKTKTPYAKVVWHKGFFLMTLRGIEPRFNG